MRLSSFLRLCPSSFSLPVSPLMGNCRNSVIYHLGNRIRHLTFTAVSNGPCFSNLTFSSELWYRITASAKPTTSFPCNPAYFAFLLTAPSLRPLPTRLTLTTPVLLNAVLNMQAWALPPCVSLTTCIQLSGNWATLLYRLQICRGQIFSLVNVQMCLV